MVLQGCTAEDIVQKAIPIMEDTLRKEFALNSFDFVFFVFRFSETQDTGWIAI